jgi:hypothetical protein
MKNSRIFLLISVIALLSSCSDDSNDVGSPLSDARDKFTGTWLCKETINGSTLTFTIVINKVGSEDSVSIKNFSGYSDLTFAGAYVSSSSLTIPQQAIGTTSIPVQGSGIYSDAGGTEKITMNYNTDGQAATAVCTK